MSSLNPLFIFQSRIASAAKQSSNFTRFVIMIDSQRRTRRFWYEAANCTPAILTSQHRIVLSERDFESNPQKSGFLVSPVRFKFALEIFGISRLKHSSTMCAMSGYKSCTENRIFPNALFAGSILGAIFWTLPKGFCNFRSSW